jgi:hypothetical protein
MPYYIPFRHRQRTKSENADAPNSQPSSQDSMDCDINEKNLDGTIMMDAQLQNVNSNPQFNKIKISQLKKSKSMESLLPKIDTESKVNVVSSSTLEFVSNRIQKLKFNE